MDTQSDIFLVYNQLIDNFYELFPDKRGTVNVSNTDIKQLVNRFCLKFKMPDNEQYFPLLLRSQGKVFKAIKTTLIPQFKMEVVLLVNDKTTEDKHLILNNMWMNIWLLYLLGENSMNTPDKIKISRISIAIENKKNPSQVQTLPLNDMMQGLDLKGIIQNPDFKSMMQSSEIKNMMQNPDIQSMMQSMMQGGKQDSKPDLKSMIEKVDMNQIQSIANSDQFKSILSQFHQEPTTKSNSIVHNILSDIKNNVKINEQADGKVNSKDFVSEIVKVGSSISDTYGEKFSSGELDLNDIIGAITTIANSPDENMMKDLIQTLKIKNVDMNEVIDELKDRFKDKIPAEIMSLIGNLDISQLENFDMGSILGSMLGGSKDEPITELTEEQKKELMDYYDKLKA